MAAVDRLNKIAIELKRAENLKQEVRNKWELPSKGLVIKTIFRNSPATFDYVSPTSFLGHIEEKFSHIDMKDFVKIAREKL